ncbi:hypothetical protein [Sphingobacterium prati]|uniref:hypothetical protein n=1 Tax=Sphingobacterium prati TaxID=2737006 RepID=UPI00155829FB|nr:hypothetical protein [Sphingobacterium prati]NPE44978.1 hypothetical protein [Sphingobacterium prati]
MNKRKIMKAVLGSLAAVTMCVGFAQSNTLKSSMSPKVARAAFDVSCYCAFWGGNNNCAANNGGSQCAPAGSSSCSSYNSNCEG